jgi:hypothetical protein
MVRKANASVDTNQRKEFLALRQEAREAFVKAKFAWDEYRYHVQHHQLLMLNTHKIADAQIEPIPTIVSY